MTGGRDYSEAEAAKLQICHPANLKTLFATIVGVLAEAHQVQALEALINLVRSSCGNIEACFGVGLQRDILKFLSERGLFVDPCVTVQVLKKILRLLLYLANHSVNIDDIRAMLGVFRSMRLVHEAPDDTAVSYYLSTLEMIARDSFGPASFFDLSGEYSGLVLPMFDSFPNNGYTFCAWIKFETLPEVAAPLFTFWYVSYRSGLLSPLCWNRFLWALSSLIVSYIVQRQDGRGHHVLVREGVADAHVL